MPPERQVQSARAYLRQVLLTVQYPAGAVPKRAKPAYESAFDVIVDPFLGVHSSALTPPVPLTLVDESMVYRAR
jgi:hypothetical protein